MFRGSATQKFSPSSAFLSSQHRSGLMFMYAVRAEEPAVETAEEAKEPAEADINELCKDMFNKMATYLTGELTATSEDYKLLENMNKLTSLKYLEMKDIAINISRNLKDLNQKYAALQPYLEQINLIEEQVAALEQAAYKLDAYSKKLGNYCPLLLLALNVAPCEGI
uniref:Biosis of lysosomal organelles complex 1 subunit 2 n=3 Tax=Casuariiformes TaxID=8784 RepID=A0A8C4K7V9_DRONO